MIIPGKFWLLTVLGLIFMMACLFLDRNQWQETAYKNQIRLMRNIFALIIVAIIVWLAMINFMAALTILVIVTGIVSLIDVLFFRKKRKEKQAKMPLMIEYSRSFFGVLLLVWVIRSFIIQPYRVPTGSLEPTVRAGDFIAVNQFAYGFRFPVLNNTLIPTGRPKLGDITLFYFPPNPSILLVKRTIGTPGDHIVYKNKVLYINGREMKQELLGKDSDVEPSHSLALPQETTVLRKSEELGKIKHEIFVRETGGYDHDFDIVVPPGMYFMMGDNRDNSDDSRYWGFVPEDMLIGKVFASFMSWDAINHRIRWDRIGHWVR